MSRPRHPDGLTRKAIVLHERIWTRVADFRFGNRLKSEALALRQLVAMGLDADGVDPPDDGPEPECQGVMVRKGILLTEAAWARVADFQCARRVTSEAETLRRLVRSGLDAALEREAAGGDRGWSA